MPIFSTKTAKSDNHPLLRRKVVVYLTQEARLFRRVDVCLDFLPNPLPCIAQQSPKPQIRAGDQKPVGDGGNGRGGGESALKVQDSLPYRDPLAGG